MTLHRAGPTEPKTKTIGTPWSSWEDQDIRWGLDHNSSIEEIADFLCRTPSEVRQRIRKIAETDAIGDPSLLGDGLTGSARIALETYRDARAAMALIREAVEDCAPPGSVTREGYLTPEFTVQAEALVRGIYAIADRCPPKQR
jgi:DNA-binding Lrp family transcriptional regulator